MEVIQFFLDLGYKVKIDGLLSIAFNRPIIDIFDFDYQVHKKFDPDNNYSLEYLLLKYYDTEIVDKIKYFSGANARLTIGNSFKLSLRSSFFFASSSEDDDIAYHSLAF